MLRVFVCAFLFFACSCVFFFLCVCFILCTSIALRVVIRTSFLCVFCHSSLNASPFTYAFSCLFSGVF